MDCTASQSLMMDELYGELDVDASADLAAHLADCEECRAEMLKLQGWKGDLHVPAVEVPSDLHERIMARVDAALAETPAAKAEPLAPVLTPRVPWGLSRVVSLAGAWAMRPQTAMAAVFLLMVGSSAWLLRGQNQPAASADFEQGAPLAAPAPSSDFNPEAAREAHGLGGGGRAATPTAAAAAAAPAMPPSPPAAQAGPLALGDGKGRSAYDYDDQAPGAAKAEAPRDELAPSELRAKSAASEAGGGFAEAMAAYRAARYDDATARFDALARQGDRNAELWAARSVRDGHGCRTALTRFDHLGSTAMGSTPGNDAILEGALCYRQLGQIESSTQHLQRLLAYEGYSQRARAELETNRRILVARKEAEGNAAGTGGAAARSPAPAKPKAATDDQ